MNKLLALSALVLWIGGCSAPGQDPKEAGVREGAAFVKRLLDGTQRNMMSGLAFASAAEQGGSVVTFVAASLPENASFTCYVDGPPKQPYCVSIRAGSSPKEYVIEGYGADLSKPIVVEKAEVGMPKPGARNL